MVDELMQEPLFLLVVPVGLLHRTARGPDRTESTARCIGSELMGLRGRLLVDLPCLEPRDDGVADILQDQRLGAVANHHPIAARDLQHTIPPVRRDPKPSTNRPTAVRALSWIN